MRVSLGSIKTGGIGLTGPGRGAMLRETEGIGLMSATRNSGIVTFEPSPSVNVWIPW